MVPVQRMLGVSIYGRQRAKHHQTWLRKAYIDSSRKEYEMCMEKVLIHSLGEVEP